jgi:hypothetical protein
MKQISVIVLATALISGVAFSEELSSADQKWAAAVEKMLEKGVSEVSTPDAKRAKLAVDLAKKQNRVGRIEKKDSGFRIIIDPTSTSATVASRTND